MSCFPHEHLSQGLQILPDILSSLHSAMKFIHFRYVQVLLRLLQYTVYLSVELLGPLVASIMNYN